MKGKYEVRVTSEAWDDLLKLDKKLQKKAYHIFKNVLAENPFVGEKLVGKLKGNFSYRLTLKIRIIYSVEKKQKKIYIKKVKVHQLAYRE